MATPTTAIGCILKEPIAGPTGNYKIGQTVELPVADFDQLKRWSCLRAATVAEIIAFKQAP
jgi:hypothetical protein